MKNLKQLCGYFTDEAGIKVPDEIQNAISDVFRENDDVDQVLIYHPEEAEEFCKDITLLTDLVINVNGQSEGTVQNVYTYYGDPEYFMFERIILMKDDEIYEEIRDTTKVFDGRQSQIFETDDYYIILREDIKFAEGDSSREFNLLIYCPESVEELSDDDRKFREIYNQLMEDE